MDKNNKVMRLPDNVKTLMKTLNDKGYEAYVVGGAVRDYLMGIKPHDYDLCTNARPEEIKSVFEAAGHRVVDKLGENFGTVNVVADGVNFEITTFRSDYYRPDKENDTHKPDSIVFADTLKEDLSRRDFTINAMACDVNGNIYDYHGGKKDIETRTLRTVGNASERFLEDPLRMMRACRFIGMGFTYKDDNSESFSFGKEGSPYYIKLCYKFDVKKMAGIAIERVKSELEKILMSDYAGKALSFMAGSGLFDASCSVRNGAEKQTAKILPELTHTIGCEQNPAHHKYDVFDHIMLTVDSVSKSLDMRWAALLHDVAKGRADVRGEKDGQPTDYGHAEKSAEIAEAVLKRFCYSDKFIRPVKWYIGQHMNAFNITDNMQTLMRHIRKTIASGKLKLDNAGQLLDHYVKLAELRRADMVGTGKMLVAEADKSFSEFKKMLETVFVERKFPVTTKDLAITGKDAMEFVSGKMIAPVLKAVLERVQSGNLPNDRSVLLNKMSGIVMGVEEFKEDVRKAGQNVVKAGADCARECAATGKRLTIDSAKKLTDNVIAKYRFGKKMKDVLFPDFVKKCVEAYSNEVANIASERSSKIVEKADKKAGVEL